MPDETKKTEEQLSEETQVEETQAEETKNEIPQKVLDDQNSFDAKLDSEEDDSVVEETSKEEEKATEETDTGAEEEVAEKTAEEKLVDEEAKTLEAEILAAEKPAEEKKEEKEAEEDTPFDCGLDPEEWDKEVIDMMNAQGETFKKNLKNLSSENAELKNLVQQQVNQRYADWLDRQFDGLGESMKEIVGEGDMEDIEPASVPYENRLKVVSRMDLVTKTYQKLKKPVPTKSKLFKQAVEYLFNKEINKEKTDAETVKKLKSRADQTLGRGSKQASKLSAEDKVLQIQKDFDAKLDE
jgi:hypothetical protein